MAAQLPKKRLPANDDGLVGAFLAVSKVIVILVGVISLAQLAKRGIES